MSETEATRRRAGRSSTWWALGALAALSAVVVTAPASMAQTYTPPYAHVQETKYDFLRSVTGCARETSGSPTYSAPTGNETWWGKTAAGTCSASAQKAILESLAEAEGATELAIPVTAPSGRSTPTTFNVTWNITASGAIGAFKVGACVDPLTAGTSGSYECTAAAIAELIGGAWLVDLTTGNVTLASNQPIVSGIGYEKVNYTICTPNCTSYSFPFRSGAAFSGPQTDTFTINSTTDHADRYAIVTFVGGLVIAGLEGYTGHVAASVNIGTHGNGAQLVSIVES